MPANWTMCDCVCVKSGKSIFSRIFAVDLDGKSCNRWIISDPADSTNFHRVFGCKSPLNSPEKKSCIGVRACLYNEQIS